MKHEDHMQNADRIEEVKASGAAPCSALAEEVARLAQGLRDDAHTCDRVPPDEADRMIDIADRLDALIENAQAQRPAVQTDLTNK